MEKGSAASEEEVAVCSGAMEPIPPELIAEFTGLTNNQAYNALW